MLGALASRDDATAQQIHALLVDAGERVGLATVYRTLKSLSESGVVDTLSHHRGETCYRLCGDGHHHHLVCSGCHRVIELGDCELDPWLADLAAQHGFTLDAHTVEVSGRCPRARRSAPLRSPAFGDHEGTSGRSFVPTSGGYPRARKCCVS